METEPRDVGPDVSKLHSATYYAELDYKLWTEREPVCFCWLTDSYISIAVLGLFM